MDTKYWNKKKLYIEIDKLRLKLGIDYDISSYPISPIKLAKNSCKNLLIETISFSSSNICGILYKGDTTTTIALNNKRDTPMQNFDCMHELIHYFIHDISYCQLICSDNTIDQDKYIEWQANEGAAQFLVPYQIFIPRYLELEEQHANSVWYDSKETLAELFNVTTAMITNRIKNLEHSILHYKLNKNKINDINKDILIISNIKAQKMGLVNTLEQLYCINCLNTISIDYKFCPTCGNYLLKHKFIDLNRKKGVGYLLYPEKILVTDGKARICPICENENLNDGEFCKICGTYVVNKCSYQELDCNGNIIEECGTLCDGSSRFCPKCGSKTTFYQNGILENWEKEKYKITNEIEDLPF